MRRRNTHKGSLWLAGIVTFALAGTFPNIARAVDDPNESLFDMNLEELMEVEVTTLSRVEERRDDAAGSIYVYPRSLLKARGITSLGELLRTVPGFTVFHRDLQYVVGVRGLNANDNEKVTLMINGQEINGIAEPDYLNGPINLEGIERVEVVVGPSSFFQRANTLAATVNVITREADGSEVSLSTGNEKYYSTTFRSGKQLGPDKRFDILMTTEKKRGFDAWESDFRPNLVGNKDTGRLNEGNYFGVATFSQAEWSAQAIAYRTEFPELLINNGNPLNEGIDTDEVYSLQLENEHKIDTELSSFFRTSFSLRKAARVDKYGLPEIDSACEQSLAQRDYEAELGLRYSGFDNHFIQTGIQGAYEDNYDCWFTWNASDPDSSFPEETTLYDKDTSAVGFYVDDNFAVNEDLTLVNGLRVDGNTILADKAYLGGHSGVIYRATEDWTTKLIYNRAVRYPTPMGALNEVWGRGKEGPVWTRHFPNVEDAEVLSTCQWQNIYYLGKARIGVTAYYQKLNDFISWSEPHSNVGDFEGWGIENELYYTINEKWNYWANCAYNDSRLSPFYMSRTVGGAAEQHHVLINSENKIVGSADFTANTGMDYQVKPDVTLTGAVRYFTGQVAHDYTASEFRTINDRYYLDAALLWEKVGGKDCDLRFSVMNILNNRKEVGGQWLGDTYKPRGMTFLASAYFRF